MPVNLSACHSIEAEQGFTEREVFYVFLVGQGVGPYGGLRARATGAGRGLTLEVSKIFQKIFRRPITTALDRLGRTNEAIGCEPIVWPVSARTLLQQTPR
jgi:hypothetical protein